MTGPEARAAVAEELARHGHDVPETAYDHDLIGLGVNSPTLIQVLSALEDACDADFDMDGLFSAPLTVARLAAQITYEPRKANPVSDDAGYQQLTPSGMGALLPWNPGDSLADSIDEFAALARKAALDSGCVLARGLELGEDAFKRLVHALGNTVDHKFGEGQADLLKLNASRDEGKVVTGRGPLPLHTDGLLVGERVDLIILYAAEFSDEPGSGETYVSDQLTAWREMPARLRRVIEERELEYLVAERGYFPTVPESWYTIPTTRDYGRVRSLNLSTAFPPDVLRSWDIRVKGMDSAESEQFFEELDAYLRSERYAYTHRWEVGDLLVIDNQRTLHGRTAISPGGTRVLFRGQLTLPQPA